MTTLLLPVTRDWTRERVCAAIGRSDIPRGKAILVLDAPGCEAWEQSLAALGFTVEVHRTGIDEPVPADRIARRARHAKMREFTVGIVPDGELLILDDDTLVPPHVYTRLKAAGPHATGIQRSRHGNDLCGVYRGGHALTDGHGVEPIDFCGHYCLLTTGEMYRKTATHGPRECFMRPIPGLKADWNVMCGHLTEDGVLMPKGYDPEAARWGASASGIPKIIYTTWVSDEPMPAKFVALMETWRRVMPDYEIRVLDLDDVPRNEWTEAALRLEKPKGYVLAGHYARIQRVYETGGVYLDLDVEAVRSFDPLLKHAAFMGVETDSVVNNAIFGAEAGHPFLAECMAYMDGLSLDDPNVELETGPRMFTNIMLGRGWKRSRGSQTVGDIQVLQPKCFYPYLYTEPYDPKCITADTFAIHHWAYSWNPALKEPVSVIIPCYDMAEFLPDAIDSVLAQTVPVAEIIVVDDCSTKGDVAAACKPYGKRVRRIRHRTNKGVAAARNTGIKASTGAWIATLDADDKLAPTFVEKTIGRDDIVSTTLLTFGAQSLLWRPPKKRPVCADFVRNNQINCCSLFRREVWERVGGYDETMRDGYEDWDFWTRATHAGFSVTCVYEPLFLYRKHPGDRSHVRGSVDGAKTKHAEILAYMHEKWAALGMDLHGRVRAPIVYPVRLAKDCAIGEVRYPKGTHIDHETALALKAAGELCDPRIR